MQLLNIAWSLDSVVSAEEKSHQMNWVCHLAGTAANLEGYLSKAKEL